MAYSGNERRVHKVFVTRNTEYHVRRDVCVAVRDRRSGDWIPAHVALKQRISGGLKFLSSGGVTPNGGAPQVGESMFFHAGGRDIVTSTVLAIDRPERDVVLAYPN